MAKTSQPVEFCYLLLMPRPASLPAGTREPATVKKDVPYFFDLDIEFLSAGERRLEVDGTSVNCRFQMLDDQIWLAECRFAMPDLFNESAVRGKQVVQTTLKRRFQQELGYTGAFFEEYIIVLLRDIGTTPDEFVVEGTPVLARLLRSLDKPLTDVETDQILAARSRYADDDLIIIDWEGAVVIAGDGDFQSEIELLKIGNYQLLRYRLVDRAIERSLEDLRQHVSQGRRRGLGSRRKTFQQIIEQRLALLLDFEKIDQSLLLIGDWYSAQVYRLIVDEFYLDEWKSAVSAKLDNLTAIDEIVRQNLAFSWDHFLSIIEIAGWLFLLVGYFVLFFVDIGWFG
ncbi:MAG: hypothetical protein AB1801_11725 [Chloroflexota bacterium]